MKAISSQFSANYYKSFHKFAVFEVLFVGGMDGCEEECTERLIHIWDVVIFSFMSCPVDPGLLSLARILIVEVGNVGCWARKVEGLLYV